MIPMTQNSTIKALTSHVSVRDFTSEPVSEADRNAIFEAARASSSSCFLQVVTVIRITDPEKRRAFVKLTGGQRHIESAAEFWVFCADYHRCEAMTGKTLDLGWTEQLLVGCTDVAIMAQSAMAALESLGLGGVYAGGIRNSIEEVDRLLGLPENVIPVLGLAFGHPAYRNELKPRLPREALLCENTYREPDPALLENYDRELARYYETRSRNPKKDSWKAGIERILLRERRPFLLAYLQKKGFGKR